MRKFYILILLFGLLFKQASAQNNTVLLNPTFGISDEIDMGNLGATPQQGSITFFMNLKPTTAFPNVLSTNFINGCNSGIRFEFCNPCNKLFAVVLGDSLCGYNVHTYMTGSAMQFDTWYHITLTWDMALNNVKGYVDGTLVFDEANTQWDLKLANVVLGVGYNVLRTWTGYLDDVTIWQKRLTQTEITNLNSRIINTSDPSLKAYWNFNTNTGAGANITVPNVATATLGSYNGITVGTPETPIFTAIENTVPRDSIFSGGAGDGFSYGIGLLSMSGIPDSIFSGGSGDGFNSTLSSLTFQPATDSIYRGGYGDGFSNTVSFINNAAIIDSLYRGGISDGFGSNIGMLTSIGVPDSLYRGGAADGFTAIAAVLIVAGVADSMYAGGAGRGEDMVAADLLNLSVCGPVLAWNGNVSNVWNDPANWDCGIVPGINAKVYLPAGLPRYPAISASAEIKSLIISKGATIMIMPNVHLKLNGRE